MISCCDVDSLTGERAETVSRKPQDWNEETEGRAAGIDVQGAEERCISSAERGEGHPTSGKSKTASLLLRLYADVGFQIVTAVGRQ